MCDSKRDVRPNKTALEFLKSLARDTSGAVAIYIAIVAPVMLGIGALSVDLGRLMTLNTELQGAADAAALAGARELDRFPGSMAKASAAAVAAVSNSQTFANDGGGKQVLIDATPCANPPVAPCIRFLKNLPADDGDPITAGNVTTSDTEARFIDVHVGARAITNILVTIVGGPGTASTSATAVAGNDQVICDIPPMFMCNPTEPAGNTDLELAVDTSALEGRQLSLFIQGGGGLYTPGNFGLLCPSGTEGATNCGGKAVKDALASTTGTCVSKTNATTKTGVTLQMVRTGINARQDYWMSQAIDADDVPWRQQDIFRPAANVTQGGKPPANVNGDDAKCQYSGINADEGMGLPRDACHLNGTCDTAPGNINGNDRIGDGTWDHLEYFRINHGCNQSANPTCKPADWDALTGAAGWPPTRYEVYRFELERTPEAIVEPNQTIYDTAGNAVETTTEDGHAQCFQGTPPPIPGYNYFPSKVRDLTLLDDRRIMPIAVTNCNAMAANGMDTNGKFSFNISEVSYVFLTETMPKPSDSAIYAEVLGTLDEGALNSLTRDIVQLYRR